MLDNAFKQFLCEKSAIFEYFRRLKKQKSASGDFWRSRTRLNLGQLYVSHVPVAMRFWEKWLYKKILNF